MSSASNLGDQPVVNLRITNPSSSGTMRVPHTTPLTDLGNVRWAPPKPGYVQVVRVGLVRLSDDALFPLVDAAVIQRIAGGFTWKAVIPAMTDTGAFLVRATAHNKLEKPSTSKTAPSRSYD
jgi:hypothetical protein